MVELTDSAAASFIADDASEIVFPPDFDDSYPLFAGVSGDDGGIYRVDSDGSQRLDDIEVNIASLDGTGTAADFRLVAGERDRGQVWYSRDGGESWEEAAKPPSGERINKVIFAGSDGTAAYAATSGVDSAVSITSDGGGTWNQVGLIDTRIDTLLDLGVSPEYHDDGTLFLLTWGDDHSLWRTQDSAASWERVFTSSLAEVDSLSRVAVSPDYDGDKQCLFLTGNSNGHPAIWRSRDNGRTFSYRAAAPQAIDAWKVVDDKTLLIGGYEDGQGVIYISDNGGRGYETTTTAGSSPPSSIAVSPDYADDGVILVGNTSGGVYLSTDRGLSFEPLPWDDASPLSGALIIAFAPEFSGEGWVFAASDSAGAGIHRFDTGDGERWEQLAHPENCRFGKITLSADGTLYAADFTADGGLERCLNPGYSLNPTFETVTGGLEDGATLVGLWQSGQQLWATDTANIALLTLYDSLTEPVRLDQPADGYPGTGILDGTSVRDIELDWDTLSGATEYQWQLDADTDFDSVLYEGNTAASAAQPPALEPAMTYYWRVRASEPVLSPWSEKWSFTTAMGSAASGPRLITPEPGEQGVSTRPVFQ